MQENHATFQLPSYRSFMDSIAPLDLSISGSELHGMMCGYLCAGAVSQGESYLRALLSGYKGHESREIARLIFNVYIASQQQLDNFDYSFQLLLPTDETSLIARAQAFSEWCEGFTQGMTCAGIRYEQFQEEDSQDALQHLLEFSQLDYEALDVTEKDEKALLEVSEYARIAVLRLYEELRDNPGLMKKKETH